MDGSAGSSVEKVFAKFKFSKVTRFVLAAAVAVFSVLLFGEPPAAAVMVAMFFLAKEEEDEEPLRGKKSSAAVILKELVAGNDRRKRDEKFLLRFDNRADFSMSGLDVRVLKRGKRGVCVV